MKRRQSGLALTLGLALYAQTAPVILHVTPGDSIEHARDAVRELKRQQGGSLKQPVIVYVHGGTYALSQPLQFGPEDSGTANCPVTYAAFGNERPVLSGGRAITGWKQVSVGGKDLWTAGDPAKGQNVEYVTFRGLTFAYAEWRLPASDPSLKYQRQSSAFVPGAVQFGGSRHCSFESCTVAHVSSYALHFSRGCRQNRIVACELFDLGAGGIKIGEPDPGSQITDSNTDTHDIQATDNQIHDGGQAFHQGVGIFVGQSYNNLIAHNHIHDFYYSGISVGWTWGYGNSLARDNVIEYNHVHDIGKGWLSDLGAIYTLGVQPGTIIRHNIFHDVQAAVYVGRGIYFDEGSSNILAENNLIYRTYTGGVGQNYGRNNIVRNNILAFGGTAQVEPSGGPAGQPSGTSLTFERNIVYWTRDESFLANPWSDSLAVLQSNLYWQEGVPPAQMRFGSRTWSQWQALGLDTHSLIADPLFVDPGKNDFRLTPESPAFKIGFQPFDLSDAGPRPTIPDPRARRRRP